MEDTRILKSLKKHKRGQGHGQKSTQDRGTCRRQLRWICNPDSLGFDTSQDCEKSDGIIGQERARKAIVMGLEISSPGYNIYASGVEERES